jgi:hypothetical protein
VIKDERRKWKNVNVEGRKEDLQKPEELIDRERREGQEKYRDSI